MIDVDVVDVDDGWSLAIGQGGGFFVESATSLAKKMKIHPMVLGVVVLGFATAMPEMIVSAMAAWHGQLGMSIGNAVGSSIANIGLVLGGTALIVPLSICGSTLRHEFPAVLLSMLLITCLVWDHMLSFFDGMIIVIGFLLMIIWVIFMAKQRALPEAMHGRSAENDLASTGRMIFCFVAGLAAMLIGSRLMIYGATGIATFWGVSDFIIGLSILAVGTSLPELAASMVAAYRGEHDLALGNVLGSNLFNMLAVMAMPALIMPGKTPEALLNRDIPLMFAFSFLMLVLAVRRDGTCRINRLSGLILLLAYVAYSIYLFN